MLTSLLTAIYRGENVLEILTVFALLLPSMLFALSLHETMHGWVALKLGDPTARNMGRLTLNPRKHVDPIGFIALMLFGFGWARPVPVNARYFKNPKWGFALVALAGPLSNFLLGLLCAVIYGVLWAFYLYTYPLAFLEISKEFFYFAAYLNFIYAIFNMIPIPPYDGSRILFAFLPQKAYFAVMRYERYILFGFLILLIFGSRFFRFSPISRASASLTNLIAIPIQNGIFNALTH